MSLLGVGHEAVPEGSLEKYSTFRKYYIFLMSAMSLLVQPRVPGGSLAYVLKPSLSRPPNNFLLNEWLVIAVSRMVSATRADMLMSLLAPGTRLFKKTCVFVKHVF